MSFLAGIIKPEDEKHFVKENQLYVWTCKVSEVVQHLMFNLPPNQPFISLHYLVNAQKGLTVLFCTLLLLCFRPQQHSIYAYIYMGLHGGYGVVWLLKDFAVPDVRFRQMVSATTCIGVVVLLAAYWYLPFITVKNLATRHANEGERCFWACFSTTIGVCLMIGADTQKYIQLKYKKGLVSDGFFALTRNPNYLGEIMIYGGFGIMASDCTAWVILLSVWTLLFGTGILRKELSYIKKAGWQEYKSNSLILLPRIHANYWANYAIYGATFFIARLFYSAGGLFAVFGVTSA